MSVELWNSSPKKSETTKQKIIYTNVNVALLKYAGPSIFQNCWQVKILLTKYAGHLVFSKLLTGRGSVLLKYAGHLFFQNCWAVKLLSTKYVGHLVFSELLTSRISFTKMCRPFSFIYLYWPVTDHADILKSRKVQKMSIIL